MQLARVVILLYSEVVGLEPDSACCWFLAPLHVNSKVAEENCDHLRYAGRASLRGLVQTCIRSADKSKLLF